MENIPNTEYITIKKEGVFVGGKPATRYRGKEILYLDGVKVFLSSIQKKNPEIKEVHVGTFVTKGKYGETDVPSGKPGKNIWCRVVLADGEVKKWVCLLEEQVPAFCAYQCINYLMHMSSFRNAVLGKNRGPVPRIIKIIRFGSYKFTIERTR
jgi:hypothetical protein